MAKALAFAIPTVLHSHPVQNSPIVPRILPALSADIAVVLVSVLRIVRQPAILIQTVQAELRFDASVSTKSQRDPGTTHGL